VNRGREKSNERNNVPLDIPVCGISTQVHQAVPGFDEVVSHADADFAGSGLLADSVIRLGFLAVLPRRKLLGGIGRVDRPRHARLLRNLSRHLLAGITRTPNQ
jgi:mRNA interferase MazF